MGAMVGTWQEQLKIRKMQVHTWQAVLINRHAVCVL